MKRNEKFVKQILVASVAVGLIAAVAIYAACSFARCPPQLSKLQFALLFFAIGFAISFVMKSIFVSATR